MSSSQTNSENDQTAVNGTRSDLVKLWVYGMLGALLTSTIIGALVGIPLLIWTLVRYWKPAWAYHKAAGEAWRKRIKEKEAARKEALAAKKEQLAAKKEELAAHKVWPGKYLGGHPAAQQACAVGISATEDGILVSDRKGEKFRLPWTSIKDLYSDQETVGSGSARSRCSLEA